MPLHLLNLFGKSVRNSQIYDRKGLVHRFAQYYMYMLFHTDLSGTQIFRFGCVP